jgi:hypothetical protein
VSILVLGTVALEPGLAAEKSTASGLEDYLVHLGYGVAVCKNEKPNRLLLEGVLGARKRVFVVDTGWTMTTLDVTSARGMKPLRELGVAIQGRIPSALTNFVLMEKLTLGGSQFLNQPAAVGKLDMDFITREEDGVLGCDFLLRNFCLIDCREGRLYFRNARRWFEELQAMEESLRQSGFIEALTHGDQEFTIDSKIKNLDVRLLVDTGSFYSMLDESQVGRLSLTMEKRKAPETGSLITDELSGKYVGVGKIGAHKFRVTTLSSMQIGARKWKNAHFGVVNLKSWGVGMPNGWGEHIQGLLGADVLIGAGALIDCSSGKLWFRPEKSEPR